VKAEILMAAIRAPRRTSSLVLLALLAGTAGLFSAQRAASADGGLSSTVLSSTLPGLVLAPPGAGNGPVTGASLEQLGVASATASTVQGDVNDGALSGYFRTWSRQPTNGDEIAVGAFRFRSQLAADAFVAGANNDVKVQRGVVQDNVASVPGASLYSEPMMTAGSTQLAFFTQGPYAFLITVRSPSGDLTLQDAVTLADRQAARVSAAAAGFSASTSGSRLFRVGEVVGVLALAGLLVWLVSMWFRPRRTSNVTPSAASPLRATTGSDVYPPPPWGDPESGWRPSPSNMNEQLFWDGRQWAGRRRWMAGTGWVEVVPAPASL
jgi:hypothetical protein